MSSPNPEQTIRLTATELGLRLQVHRKTVLRLAREGAIPSIQVGQQLRFDPIEVEAALSRNHD